MTIPNNVEDQAKKAEELQKRLANGNTDPAPPTPAEQNTPPVEMAEETLAPGNEGDPAPAPVNVIAPEPDNPIETTVEDGVAKPVTDWEQKYKVLSGKYNAEIPAMQQQLNQISGQMQFLQNENLNLKQQVEQKPVDDNQGKVNGDGSLVIDPAKFEEYGEEFVLMAKTLNGLRGQVDKTVNTVEESAKAQAARDWNNHTNRLQTEIPDYITVNNDPGFISWLKTVNPYTGVSRHESLTVAHKRMESDRVIAIFQEYINGNSAVDNPPNPGPIPVTPPKDIQGVSPSPDRTGGDLQPAPAKKTYTKKQINDFYKNVAQGKFTGQQAWIEATQADILAAGREHRII